MKNRLCRIFGHDWVSSICQRCGITTDEFLQQSLDRRVQEQGEMITRTGSHE